MLIKEKYLEKISGPALVLYWIALFISTHIPMPQLPPLPENSDKVMHFVAYTGLAFLFTLWRSTKTQICFSEILFITGVIACYANIEELLQIPVNRFCDPKDVFADWTGMVIGLLLFWVWHKLGSKLIIIPAK